MGDLRDRLEDHFREMDELRRDRDVWRDRYLALVDQKDRHRANAAACIERDAAVEAAREAARGDGDTNGL